MDRRTALRALTVAAGATLLLAAEASDAPPTEANPNRTALFFSPHQDDEVLQQLVEIIRHVDDGWHVVVVEGSIGNDTVAIDYVNGTAFCDYHEYRHKPPKLLTPGDIGRARTAEQRSTCQIAGVHEYVPGMVTDGALVVEGWRKIILGNAGRLKDGDRVFVPTPWESTSGIGNPQHGDAGIALQQLLSEPGALPVVDAFYTVFSRYWDQPGCPIGVTRGFVNDDQQARAIAAAEVYRAFNPAAGSYGIGWCHSVPSDFEAGFADQIDIRDPIPDGMDFRTAGAFVADHSRGGDAITYADDGRISRAMDYALRNVAGRPANLFSPLGVDGACSADCTSHLGYRRVWVVRIQGEGPFEGRLQILADTYRVDASYTFKGVDLILLEHV